jgi:hypothetical protein
MEDHWVYFHSLMKLLKTGIDLEMNLLYFHHSIETNHIFR